MFDIAQSPFFSFVSPALRATVKERMRVKHYGCGEIIFYEGDKSRDLHLLLQGTVKTFKTTPKGNRIHINRIRAPSLLAEFTLFVSAPFPVTCECDDDVTLGLLDDETIGQLLEEPDVAAFFVRTLSRKVWALTRLVHQETVHTSEAKVADFVLHKSDLFSMLKHREIASLLNIAPETFSRILAKFKNEGWVDVLPNGVRVLDAQALASIVE